MATTWAGTATNQGITRTAMNDLWNTYTNGNYPWCDGCTLPANSLQLITKAYFTSNYYYAGAGNYLINTAKTSLQVLVKSDIGVLINLYTTTGACNYGTFVTTIYLNSTLTLAYTNTSQTTLYNGGGTQRATPDIVGGTGSSMSRITINSSGAVTSLVFDFC
jgi:hypothetical protein